MILSRTLVIVESPHKAETIQKMVPKGWTVEASKGHIRDLPSKKPYGKFGALSIDLTKFEGEYVIIPEKRHVVDQLKRLADKADQIFLCPDPDREGEGIAFHLFEALELDPKKTQRVTFNEITKKAVLDAFAAPRSLDMNLVDSQQARRFMDRIVGYQLSPFLWGRVFRGLTAGRVQSIAVKILSEREREIMGFKPEEYWTLGANMSHKHPVLRSISPFKAEVKIADGKKIVSSADDLEKSKTSKDRLVLGEKEARTLVEDVSKGVFTVLSVDSNENKRRPYPPFNTSSLQQAAANVLGFDTKRTMRVAQRLYEGVQIGPETKGLITYMRTDSFSVSKDAGDDAEKLINSFYGPNYYPDKRNFYSSKKGAQEAHECVRPTDVTLKPGEASKYLDDEQFRLYKLIWDKFVSSQMTPAVYESTSVEIGCDKRGAILTASGRVVKFDGWTKVSGHDDGPGPLPDMKKGETVSLSTVLPEKHFTQPPPRFNEASLIKKLEEEGIGRPSTYSSIIEVIQARGYVEKTAKGGKAPLKATDIGLVVTDELVKGAFSIMDVSYTRTMEEELDKVAEGTLDYRIAMQNFYGDFSTQLKTATKAGKSTKSGTETTHPCPKCGLKLFKRLSRFGWFFSCPDETCKHIMTIDEAGNPKEKDGLKPSGIKCDKCGDDVIKATGRFGVYYACAKYMKDKSCSFTMASDKKTGNPKRKFEVIKTGETCPKCKKSELVIRVAGRRKSGPNPFISCSGFPRCRHSDDLPAKFEVEGKDAVTQWVELRAKDKKDAVVISGEPEETVDVVEIVTKAKQRKKK